MIMLRSNWRVRLLFLLVAIINSRIESKHENNKLLRYLTQCDISQNVTGINGRCYTFNPSELSYYAPDSVKSVLKILIKLIEKAIGWKTNYACLGDFVKSDVTEGTHSGVLEKCGCDKIPTMSHQKMFYGGVMIDGLPCGAPTDKGKPAPISAKICFAYNKCGDVALNLDLGLAACVASYALSGPTGGIAAVVANFHDIIKDFGFGFSLDGNYMKEAKEIGVLNDNGDLEFKDIQTRGSLYFNLGFGIPTEFLKPLDDLVTTESTKNEKSTGKKISDIISLEVQSNIMIDLGDIRSVVQNSINTILNANSDNAKKLLSSVLNLGREISVTMTGTMSLGFSGITYGIIPDFSFTLANVSAIISRGGNGSSRAPVGVYMSFTNDLVGDLINNINGIIDQYAPIVKKLGLDLKNFNVPAFGIGLSLSIMKKGVAFRMKTPLLTITCIFRWDLFSFSCQFGSQFFTAIKEGIQYVFSKATKFFQKGGQEISRVFVNAWKVTSEAVSKAIASMRGWIKDGVNLIKVGSEAFKNKLKEYAAHIKYLAEEAFRKAKDAAEAIKRAIEDAARKTKEAAEFAARRAAELAKQAAEAAKAALQKAAKWAKIQAEKAWCATKYFWSKSKRNSCYADVDRKYS